MGRIRKKLKLAKSNHEEEQELKPSPIVLSSDDEEANEDLSLKFVEKAMLRACSTGGNDLVLDESNDVVVVNLLPSLEAEVVTNAKDDTEKRKKKKKNNENMEMQNDTADVAKGEKEAETDTLLEMNAVEKSDNIVLRKLLRGPRYFDPPDSSWGACYNCGEEGHKTANCTSAKRKKPCFVCGNLEHNARQCKEGKDCYICKKGGHRAKNCPEKSTGGSQSAKICLKCGDSGHDMFLCKNDYSTDDLKEIQCYICKRFGHLCCVSYSGTGPREVSCYRCGQLGHTGLACTWWRAEKTGMGSFSSCYKCGKEGHFARECAGSAKIAKTKKRPSSIVQIAKRNGSSSTPEQNYSEENINHREVRSVPLEQCKAHNRKRSQYEGRSTGSSKSKQRGGWITEDPGDFPRGKYNANGWRSPTIPTNKTSRSSYYSVGGGHASSSSRKGQQLHYGNSASNGSAEVYHQHRFSAPRFGNSSNGSAEVYHQHRFSASRFGSSSNNGVRNYYHNSDYDGGRNYW